MIDASQIPDEVWRRVQALTGLSERECRIVSAAALNAWPGAEERTSGYYPNGIGGPGEEIKHRLILPLQKEPRT